MNIIKTSVNEDGIVSFKDSDDPLWSGSYHINNPEISIYLSQEEVDAILAEQGEATKTEWLNNWLKDSGQAPQE
jgi:hypothetical protein